MIHAKQCSLDGATCKIPFCGVLKAKQHQKNTSKPNNLNYDLGLATYDLQCTPNTTNNIKLIQNTTNNNSNNNISLKNFIVFQTKNPMVDNDEKF